MCATLPSYGLQDLRELLGMFTCAGRFESSRIVGSHLFSVQGRSELVKTPCSMVQVNQYVDQQQLNSF